MKIILAATGGFAIPSLEILAAKAGGGLLVVTQPDRGRGRGRRLQPTPIKNRAREMGLETITPTELSTPDLHSRLAAHTPDFLVVVDYGRIIPPQLIDLPREAAINVHPSLLPAYRGPAPLVWCLLNGEEKTGVTTQLVAAKVDTGAILLQEEYPVPPRATLEELEMQLSRRGATLLWETIRAWQARRLIPRPQDESQASYAPMLRKSDGQLDWQQPAAALERRIRALNPRPGTYTFWQGKRLKILAADLPANPAAAVGSAPPGTVLVTGDSLQVVCGQDSRLQINRLQAANRPPRETAAFLRGSRLATGDRFTSDGNN